GPPRRTPDHRRPLRGGRRPPGRRGPGHRRPRLDRSPRPRRPLEGDPMTETAPRPQVGIVMGSDSDYPVMKAAEEALAEFEIAAEVAVVSAHRMPEDMITWGRTAAERGLRVVIAGAGGAAHLPGMLASLTPLPVIGVPVPLKH